MDRDRSAGAGLALASVNHLWAQVEDSGNLNINFEQLPLCIGLVRMYRDAFDECAGASTDIDADCDFALLAGLDRILGSYGSGAAAGGINLRDSDGNFPRILEREFDHYVRIRKFRIRVDLIPIPCQLSPSPICCEQ